MTCKIRGEFDATKLNLTEDNHDRDTGYDKLILLLLDNIFLSVSYIVLLSHQNAQCQYHCSQK